ncbi:MAG: hypothetical protein M1820_010334 [Bogoriella megaspora]|nr:MAG: hypothetical protein M1820_010334 [Bogoriella megaspora]
MKTDNYLALCLEQAAKSSFRYRHGCIIVRGGKVIGQGFNDNRPGFDGGALKTGALTFDTSDVKLKQKDKSKICNDGCDEMNDDLPAQTFTPYENMGGGRNVNTPLTMHSEMMAIQSALASSNTLAATTALRQKPCFKLPGLSKRNARLRREGLKAQSWSDAVAQRKLKSSDLNPIHLDQVCTKKKNMNENENVEDNENEPDAKDKNNDARAPPWNSAEKDRKSPQPNHHHHRGHHQKTRYHQGHDQYEYHHHQQYQHSGQQHGQQQQQHVQQQHKHKRSSKQKPTKESKSTPVLLPHARANQSRHNVQQRRKSPRLNGADLYVARLGRPDTSSKPPHECAGDTSINTTNEPSSPDSTRRCVASTGSLHEELLFPEPRATTAASAKVPENFDKCLARASRPCYRCVEYMHSVGIKRVFFTTDDEGHWECRKVRELYEAFENFTDGNSDDGNVGNGAFVTKHEILMLRRTMGK